MLNIYDEDFKHLGADMIHCLLAPSTTQALPKCLAYLYKHVN